MFIIECDASIIEMAFLGRNEDVDKNIQEVAAFLQHWTHKFLKNPTSFKNVEKALVCVCIPLGVNNIQKRLFLQKPSYSESFEFTETKVEELIDKYINQGLITKKDKKFCRKFMLGTKQMEEKLTKRMLKIFFLFMKK